MALTNVAIKNASAKDKPYKLTDGEGLYLLVKPNGARLWRFKYRFEGKEKLLALGAYPAMSLLDAREARAQAKRLLSDRVDPSVVKTREKIEDKLSHENSFASVADEWFNTMKEQWSTGYSLRLYGRLKEHVLPDLGVMQIDAIQPLHILSVLRKIEDKGLGETTRRLLQICSSIFRGTSNNPVY